MIRTNILLTLSFSISVIYCRAQSDSTSHAKKTTPSCCLNFLNSGPGFSSFNNSRKTDFYSFGKLSSKPSNAEGLSSRLDYAPFIKHNQYSPLINSDFNNHYDPVNPFGATNISEGLIFGSLDYLIWKLFPEK